MRKVRFLGLVIIAILLIVVISCGCVPKGQVTPEPLPEAPKGTPLRVNAYAVYVDDSGKTVGRDSRPIEVAGVKISVFGARGQTKITTDDIWTTEDDIWFIMLAGYNYTVKATFNESTQSVRVVVEGKLASKEEINYGGYIEVEVWQSSNTIKSITYQRPAYL
jgi:hypothetical protein